MSYGQILLVFVMVWLSYFAYWLLSRGPPRAWKRLRRHRSTSITFRNLTSKKHWARGESLKVSDDGEHTKNISRIAGNTFGQSASRECVAFLVPEKGQDRFEMAVSVVVDGLRIGQLSRRDSIPFRAMLQGAGLGGQVTSCDAFIGGGGTGSDGKKQRYAISLDVGWFDA